MTETRNSVLMPVRNAAAWVGEAIESIRTQTLGDWELISVDDGSSERRRRFSTTIDDASRAFVCLPRANRIVASSRRSIAGSEK